MSTPADPLGEIPPEHPWFQAIVTMVADLKRETYDSLVAPPGGPVTAATRDYDAGRSSMADDVLTRLRRRQAVAEKQRSG